MTRVCLFVSADFQSRAVLDEVFTGQQITYLAYMSRWCAVDACIKAFTLERGIQSCPFICNGIEQMSGLGSIFDKCVVIRRNNDAILEDFAKTLSGIFRQVEIVSYNPAVATGGKRRKLSAITEE
jgi:hypothetical protein